MANNLQSRLDGRKPPQSARHGSVLLLVLIVVAMLTLGTASYLELMQNEYRAVRYHGRGVQATRLAESGVEYAKTLLALTPEEQLQAGGLLNNPKSMQAIIVDDEGDEFDRGRISIVAPAQVDGNYSGYRFGLENESAKLNINTLLAPGADQEASNRLMALPGMTPEIADAILDWLDANETLRTAGAEAETYSQLSPPYEPRNGPIADLDELLLVRGVTPELLYGVDQNRNLLVDSTESPRGVLMDLDNADGLLNRGWSAYLTTTSVEGMQPAAASASGASTSAGATTVDLNNQDLQQLYDNLKGVIGDDKAKYLIVYRQYGPYQDPQADAAAGGMSSSAPPSSTTPPASSSSTTPPPSTVPGSTGAGTPPPVEINAAAIQLKFVQRSATFINSPLDLVGTRVQIPGEENAPAQNVTSPWGEDASSYRELLKLYDAAAPQGGVKRVAGRVNINGATPVVLNSIPNLPAAAVGKIISRRELEPDMALSDQRHALWLLTEGIVTLDEMRQLERYVTTRGDVFSGQAIGFFDRGPSAARMEFIVDRSGTTPHVRLQRDLTPLGRGFSTLLLGVESDETP